MGDDHAFADPYGPTEFRRRVRDRFARRASQLAASGGDQTLNPGEAAQFAERSYKPAAVLVALIDDGEGADILLTQRSAALSAHSGQVAFPGGKIDAGETPQETALREAREEVGLMPESVEVLGTMGPYYSGSGYRISPVVAILGGPLELEINEAEVSEAFRVPLSFLMDVERHRVESRIWQDRERFFYVMPYQDMRAIPPVERRIWGVTAGIVRMIQERLYGG